jgi:hypothetical protein
MMNKRFNYRAFPPIKIYLIDYEYEQRLLLNIGTKPELYECDISFIHPWIWTIYI